MFESVVLPAPFSPRSACTSPSAASKSTWSFATTPGNRFVIPRRTTAAPRGAAVTSASLRLSSSMRVRAAPAPTLALRAPDHALHEPVHRVEVLDSQLLALRNADLPALVTERAAELVEAALDERLPLRRDLRLRRLAHL